MPDAQSVSLMRHAIGSREIWLALDDAHSDGQRYPAGPLDIRQLHPIRLRDLERYQWQLFYWLIIRQEHCPWLRCRQVLSPN